MNTTEIEKLIEKYFEGETTLEEECRIRDLFRDGDVPPHLAVYADQFRYFSHTRKELSLDPRFDDEVIKAISDQMTVQLYPARKLLFYITGIAAGIILLIGLFFTFRHDISSHYGNYKLKDTYSNPGDAYTAAKNAMLLVSVNLNTGFDEVQKLQSFQKGMDKIETFSQFYRFQQIIINPDKINKRPQNH